MSNFVANGRGFQFASTPNDYQSPDFFMGAVQYERSMKIVTAAAASDIDKMIQTHYDTLTNPDFDQKTREEPDWRNCVPFMIEVDWFNLTLRERVLVFYMAQMQADKEINE